MASLDLTNSYRGFPGLIPLDDYRSGERNLTTFPDTDDDHQQINLGLTYRMDRSAFSVINRAYFQSINEDWNNWFQLYDKNDEHYRFGNDLQFVFDQHFGNLKNNLIFGFQYEYQDYDAIRYYAKYHWSQPGVKYTDAETIRQFFSPYIQNTLHLIPDQLILSVGLRYDYIDIDHTDNLDSNFSQNSSMDRFSPKAGISYSPIPDLTLFANIGTGFRSPTGQDISRNKNLDPEKSVNYEAGFRGELFRNRLYYQVSGYYTKVDDLIAYILGGGGTPGYIDNAGEAKIKGVDLEIEAMITGGFSLFANYSYLESEFETFIDRFGNDFSGKTLPFQPKNKVAAGLRYTHPSGIYGSATYRWFDEQWVAESNELALDSYGIVDLKIGYEFRKMDFSVAVRNLFDEDYASYGEDWFGDKGLAPGEPITVFAELKFKF